MAARALMFGFLLTVAIPVAADPTLECDAAGSQVEIGACVTAMADGVQQALTASYGFAMQSAQELDRVTGAGRLCARIGGVAVGVDRISRRAL